MAGTAERPCLPIQLEAPEAAFRIGPHELCPAGGDRMLLTYLTRRVAASPGDLLSHARRVLLGQSLGLREEVFAALVDLFIATGGKGAALKQRLLATSAPLLTPLERQFLDRHCRRGLDGRTAVPSGLTVLTDGCDECAGAPPGRP